MDFPKLVRIRWQLTEFVFLEYRRSVGVFIDVGPFPQDPDEEQTESAYSYLKASALRFLTLADSEWTLDLDTLSAQFPHLKSEALSGQLTHPPAFETISSFVPQTDRWYNKDLFGGSPQGFYFLRVHFPSPEWTPQSPVLPTPEDTGRINEPDEKIEGQTADELPAGETAAEILKPIDEAAFDYYSKYSPDICKKRLKPYIPQAASSSVIQAPPHSHEFVVSLHMDSFEVKRAPDESTRYAGCYSGNFQKDKNGGTMIWGEYAVIARDGFNRFATYAGIAISLGVSSTGWAWALTQDAPFAKIFWGGCLALIGIFALVGCVGKLQSNRRDRRSIYEIDRPPLLDFVQKTLEAEPIERGEVS